MPPGRQNIIILGYKIPRRTKKEKKESKKKVKTKKINFRTKKFGQKNPAAKIFKKFPKKFLKTAQKKL